MRLVDSEAQQTADGDADTTALRRALRDLRRPPHELPPREQVLAAVQRALQLLRPPDDACDCFAELSKDCTTFAASAALRLRLLCALVPLLAPASLWPPGRAAPPCGETWPHGGEGVDDGGPCVGPACAVLAASFAGGGSLDADALPADGLPPWSNGEASAAAEALLAVLQAAWSEARDGGSDDAGQAMLSASLAARAPTLRTALLPVSPASSECCGEGRERATALRAAQALRAALSRLRHPWVSAVLPAVHPPLMLSLEALPAACRAHGALAAVHVATHATRTAQRATGGALADALLQRLCFQREPAAAWPLAVRAAAALALPLGATPRAQLLRALTAALASLPGDAHCAGPVLVALPAAARAEGLRLLLITRSLLPALLEWVCEHNSLRAEAAEALTACLEVTWPRASAHAPQIWPALLAGYRDCRGSASERARCAAALERAATQLHYAADGAFRDLWRADAAMMREDAATAPLFVLLASLEPEAAATGPFSLSAQGVGAPHPLVAEPDPFQGDEPDLMALLQHPSSANAFENEALLCELGLAGEINTATPGSWPEAAPCDGIAAEHDDQLDEMLRMMMKHDEA